MFYCRVYMDWNIANRPSLFAGSLRRPKAGAGGAHRAETNPTPATKTKIQSPHEILPLRMVRRVVPKVLENARLSVALLLKPV